MTNHPNRSRLTVVISDQHLTGNDPEGFDSTKWVSELEREYRRIVRSRFPRALCIVKIDVQRASGYCRPVSVDFEHESRAKWDDQQSLIVSIEQASNALYDSRAHEFFTEESK
jgi:hypothetical protein